MNDTLAGGEAVRPNISDICRQNCFVNFELNIPRRLNTKLAKILPALEKEFAKKFGPPDPNSPYKGISFYYSHVNLLMLNYPEFEILRQTIFNSFVSYRRQFNNKKQRWYFKSWGNIYRQGSEILLHNHKNGDVSAVYHVSGKTLKNTGNTKYFLPTSRQGKFAQHQVEFKPGRFVVHPSSIFHQMAPYQGTTARMSIAVDFSLKKNSDIYFPVEL